MRWLASKSFSLDLHLNTANPLGHEVIDCGTDYSYDETHGRVDERNGDGKTCTEGHHAHAVLRGHLRRCGRHNQEERYEDKANYSVEKREHLPQLEWCNALESSCRCK